MPVVLPSREEGIVTTVNTYGDPGADPASEWTGHRDPAAAWDRPLTPLLPPVPAGHADWEQVDQRAYYRAWKDDLPCITVDFVHGDRHRVRFFISHYRSHP